MAFVLTLTLSALPPHHCPPPTPRNSLRNRTPAARFLQMFLQVLRRFWYFAFSYFDAVLYFPDFLLPNAAPDGACNSLPAHIFILSYFCLLPLPPFVPPVSPPYKPPPFYPCSVSLSALINQPCVGAWLAFFALACFFHITRSRIPPPRTFLFTPSPFHVVAHKSLP